MLISKRKPTHPGGILKRQYLEPLGITITELATTLDVSRKTVSEIVNEKCSVTPNMALRLASAFGTTPQLWLNLQQRHDLWVEFNKSSDWQKIQPIDLQAS
ncbi:MAG: HigA family addiction module antitoxin [Nostocaceae cyanobacterium]|jgi:addiction module HigA family antidote|nr:HigA family addiction module antitoxin [Nostocaceae cyanobacterium]